MIKLGCLVSPNDDRDFHISKIVPMAEQFPSSFTIDLTNMTAHNQQQYGMCVAFSLTEIKELQEQKEKGTYKHFSPLFIYANRSNSDYRDEGMFPREALDHLLKDGVCEEQYLPQLAEVPEAYEIFNQTVTNEIRQNAVKNKISAYARSYTVNDIKTALMHLGAVLFCVPIYSNFYNTGADGIVAQPSGNLDGYHATIIVGWDDEKHSFLVLNSWGTEWGMNGYFYYNYDFPFSEAWSVTDYIENQPKPNPKKKLYKVMIGDYKTKAKAYLMQKILSFRKIKGFVVFKSGSFCVQVGAFTNEEESTKLIEKLKYLKPYLIVE